MPAAGARRRMLLLQGSRSPPAAGMVMMLLLCLVAGYANAAPLQYLPEIPGYIPVYIRHGDQPLEEINPALAEAFHESTGILKSLREIRLDDPENSSKELTDRNDVALELKEEKPSARPTPKPLSPPKQLIYTLPLDKNFAPKPKPTEKESFVMKIAKPSPLDKIDAKKIAKDLKDKEGGK